MPLIFLFVLFATDVHATMLVNRQQFLSTQVLPQGLWTFGVSHGRWTSTAGSYSGSGQLQSNRDYFSRDVDYDALTDEISDPLERELAQAAFNVYGRSGQAVAGRAVNDVNVQQSSNTYVLGRGITKRSSLFIAVPVVTLKTSIRSRFVAGESLDRLTRELRAEGQYAQAEEIIDRSRNALNERLAETGYNSDFPSELTTVANVYLTHRYEHPTGRKARWSAESSLVIPAGKSSDVDDFLYLRINEEQYSYRQSGTLAFDAHPRVQLLASTYYHFRFPFEKSRRIPVNSTSPLSSDVDSSTRVRYGDSYGASAQTNFMLADSTTFYGGLGREFRRADKVSGDRYSSKRYDYLEQNTAQELHTAYVGVAHNTIQSFLAKKFPIPVDANLQYSATTAGKNAFAAQAVSLTMLVFYK